jgi:hypothetical protein
MAYDHFMIAPINSGLQTDLKSPYYLNASLGYNMTFNQGCIMSREYRIDVKDETGKRYFDLTVIKRIRYGKHQGVMWLCQCVCGKETIAFGGHLRAGKRKSCGCWSEKRIEETGFNKLYSNYKTKAIKRKKQFSLTMPQLEKLVKENCFYCGCEPSQILRRPKSKKIQIIYNGIDRKDPNKGYSIDNCVTACKYCNYIKSNSTTEEFLARIERIYKWHMIGI